MGEPDRSDDAEIPTATRERDFEPDFRFKGGRLRRLLTGGHEDEYSEHVAPLSSAQREHLTRATDVLMKRYSISHTSDSLGSDEFTEREPVSADELGAVLHTVLAEVFDFGWFNRPDLPWAPELAYESEAEDGPVQAEDAIRPPEPMRQEPPTLRVVDLSSEPELAMLRPEPASADEDLVEPLDDVNVEEAVVEEPFVEEAVVEEPDVEEHVAEDRVAAARMTAELERMLIEAVAAEREAILFAAALRERLQSAKSALAALDEHRDDAGRSD